MIREIIRAIMQPLKAVWSIFDNDAHKIISKRGVEVLEEQKTKIDSIHNVVRSSQKKNPYKLVWYNQDWSQKRTDQNNIRYWKWEQEHNGLKLP